MDAISAKIRSLVSGSENRQEKAKSLAALIQVHGRYRWVGVYDVGHETVSILAWSGPGAPAYPVFPVTKGLTSTAITQKSLVVVNDVSMDPRYLTAFGSTRSEMIVPVLPQRTL